MRPALLLFSLGTALLSLIFAVSLVPVVSLLTSPFSSKVIFLGARHVGTVQLMPVKLLSWKPFFSHRRQGLPDRSRARRPALMAPWLALGPSFVVEMGRTPLGVLSPFSPRRGFFLGPGLPRGLGVPSVDWPAVRLEPGLGPGMPFLFAPFCGGASELLSMADVVPLSADAESASGADCGAAGSMTIGSAGVSVGVDDEDDLEREFLRTVPSVGKRASSAGGRRRIATADLGDLADIFRLEAGEAAAVTVVDELDMLGRRGVEVRRWCRRVGRWPTVAGLLIWRLPFSGRLVR